MMKLHAGDEVEYFDEVYGRKRGKIIQLPKDIGSLGNHLYLMTEYFTEPIRYLPKQKIWMTVGVFECVIERVLTPPPPPAKKMNPKLKRFLQLLKFWFKFEFLQLKPKVVEFATTIPSNATNVTTIVKTNPVCSNTSIETKRDD